MRKMAQEDGIADTQFTTQSEVSHIWLESQPIEKVIWGRLYAKNIKIKSLDLCQETFSAGRDETNDTHMTSAMLPYMIWCRISKFHFKIKRELSDLSNPVYIQDLSRNGTYLNGEKIGINRERIIQNDDVISLVHPNFKAFVFKNLSSDEISSQFYISRKIGSGACGVVRLVYDRRTCKDYAMKHVQKNLLVEATTQHTIKDPERVMNEAKILKALDHPCVIKMHDIVDKPDSLYMILELMKGGDLLNRIISNKRLSEKISKLFFYQMCHAVKYLHDKGITHRDLKPDNLLLATKDEETLLKVSDFGLSKFVQKDSIMQTLCGTPLYVAPEILLTGGRGSYTKNVDIWSLGVVLFTCLSGTLPFSDDYGCPASEQIKKGDFHFSHSSWKAISADAKTLISNMLIVNPTKRPSIDYVLKHKWLRDTEIIRKVNNIMKIPVSSGSDDENFLEPPAKRVCR